MKNQRCIHHMCSTGNLYHPYFHLMQLPLSLCGQNCMYIISCALQKWRWI